ncbi:hypothetical protein Tco_0145541 [Tanacetum coccineum]
MSQPANDDFSQHLSDDEASYHEDASDNGTATNKPKQQQQLIPTTTTISNIKLPILNKEEDDEMADDEDGGEDEEDEEDGDNNARFFPEKFRKEIWKLPAVQAAKKMQTRSGKSPGKGSLASFSLQFIPGDFSPRIGIPSDKSPGKA